MQAVVKHRRLNGVLSILLPLAFGAAFVVLWQTQLLHALLRVDTFVLPLPTRIVSILADNASDVMGNVQATVLVAVLGLALGSLLGYLIAVVATVFPKWGAGGLSVVSAFNAIPIVALSPVIINWTRDLSDEASVRSTIAKVLVVMLMCTATMSLNAFRGLNELKPFSEDLMKSYAASPGKIFLMLRLPNSVPYIFNALRVSVPLSVISTLVSEYFVEYIIGVGRAIRENIVLAQYATAWAYILAACLIGVVLYAILVLAERVLLRNRR